MDKIVCNRHGLQNEINSATNKHKVLKQSQHKYQVNGNRKPKYTPPPKKKKKKKRKKKEVWILDEWGENFVPNSAKRRRK